MAALVGGGDAVVRSTDTLVRTDAASAFGGSGRWSKSLATKLHERARIGEILVRVFFVFVRGC